MPDQADTDLIATLALTLSAHIDPQEIIFGDRPEDWLTGHLTKRYETCQSAAARQWHVMTEGDRRAAVLRMCTLLECNVMLWADGREHLTAKPGDWAA